MHAAAIRFRLIVVAGLVGGWAVAVTVGGILVADRPVGPVSIAAGVVMMACVAVALARGSWLAALLGGLIVTAGGMVGAGVAEALPIVTALGVLALVIVGAAGPIAVAVWREAPGSLAATPAGAMASATAVDLLRQLHEHTMLSDNAKRVLFRERELELLRRAIETDITERKYNVALTLCDEMGDVFGYLEEAEAFRARILRARKEQYDSDVIEAISGLETHLEHRDWNAAHVESARIKRLYGDAPQVVNLDERIARARDEHKRELEDDFLKAAERGDVERAMELLRSLDRYLGQDEAARLAEVAQGVVVRHRDNLGVQFKLAVSERRWAEAARIGQDLIREFPNTKMADEVRSMIDLIRTRATEAALTGESSS